MITFLVTPQEQPSLPLSLLPPPPPLVKNFDRSFMNENLCKIKHIDVSRSKIKASVLKMKQQQHDISLRRTRKKKSESQVGYEPTTLRDLVGCSNHLSYWRLYGD